ncbi:MAG: 4-alpha-glucanotransferase [Acidimicrobiales bacterium]|nr:4-alpha-glucanotransferase [Acidimicrobiales bacterium]
MVDVEHDRGGEDDPLGLRPWGIDLGYHDVHGDWNEPTRPVAAALRRAMGATSDDPDERPPAATPLLVLRRQPAPDGRPDPGADADPGGTGIAPHGRPIDVVLEDGTRIGVAPGEPLPPDLPYGYHRIEAEVEGTGPAAGPAVTNLIVSPGRCALPAGLRTWGVVAQLYAARSRRSWGIGDLADLQYLVDWATERGAGVVGLNPLHAPTPAGPVADSPYSPSSRRWRNPLYLAIEDVPGAAQLDGITDLVAAGRALNDGAIDRDAAWTLKRDALERLWVGFGGAPAFDRYRAERGDDLASWATFCALADHHGSGWRDWPAEHRHPASSAVQRFAADHADLVSFWAWLQWLLDEQLAASGAGDVAIADLAVGIDPDGADAWQWQELLAEGVTIGAPPDLLGPEGQDWGLPPFVPWRARDVAYAPWAATLRAAFRHARGLRIDHVMGLFRLFWIPEGAGARQGAYVRFPGSELLDVAAVESHRAGALVVGEDLGTVEPGVRELLAEAGVLSTRLLWFEDDPPRDWPAQAMAAVTTHDLPTIRGVWTGADLADQRAAGVTIPPDGDEQMRHRLRVAASSDDDATVDEIVVAAHRALADSPCAIVTATLDDLLGAEHRPNIPGTIDEHPNWRIPLPRPIDELPGNPLADSVVDTLRQGRAGA